jgi:hypothetical protein
MRLPPRATIKKNNQVNVGMLLGTALLDVLLRYPRSKQELKGCGNRRIRGVPD